MLHMFGLSITCWPKCLANDFCELRFLCLSFFSHIAMIHLSLNSKYVQLSKWNIVLPFWSRKFDFNVVSIAVYGRVNTKCDIFLGVRENRLEKQKINRRTSDIYICIDINRCRLKCFDIWCLMVYERRWFHR